MTGLTAVLLHTLSLVAGAQPYPQAFEAAVDSGRPLLVLVGADWCPACRIMKDHTLSKMEQEGKLADVSFSIVNTDYEQQLSSRLMQSSSIPQLIMYEKTDAGWKRTQLIGAQSETEVESFFKPAVQRFASAQRQAKIRVAKKD